MKFVATGRVHPERAEVSFGEIQGFIDGGGALSVVCDASQIFVAIDAPSVSDIISARIVAEDFAQMALDSLGFALASAYKAEIIQVIPDGGKPVVFGVRAEGLTFERPQVLFNAALSLAGRDMYFRLALRDYLGALSDVKDCATYCYRAIEALKSAFATQDDAKGWQQMHVALGSTREFIVDEVKQYADPVRHGNWIQARPTTAAERGRIVHATRWLLARYLVVVGKEVDLDVGPLPTR